MKKYTIYADLHLFGTHPIQEEFEYGKNVIYLGDIVDLANAYGNELRALMTMQELQIRAGNNYVFGNHELSPSRSMLRKENILFMHGDVLFYTRNRYFMWRVDKKPVKFIAKLFFVWLNNKLFPHTSCYIPKYVIKRAAEWAKMMNCHTIVFAHKHPPEVVDLEYDGIRIVCMPRGKTEIKL